MDSPPKRVTRARAAAKKDDLAGPKTTKIATAASKAKITRATSTTKRKTRADDEEKEQNEPEQQIIEPEPEVPSKSRGRPKRAAVSHAQDDEMTEAPVAAPVPTKTTRSRATSHVEAQQTEEASAPVKTTRGRPKKVAEEAVPEPTRSTRGRAKKAEAPEEEDPIAMDEPAKRPIRGRAAATATMKPAAQKKTVKFEEPDKENIIPAVVKGKGKPVEAATGLRAKPVRKPATTRATRGRKVEEKTDSSPLSPKKVTQVSLSAKESSSDDELSTNVKTPMKSLMKSPVKPLGSIFNSTKKLDFSPSTSITVNRMTTQDLSASAMASPARRPPQSPFKESMKTSPQRSAFQGSMSRSPFKISLHAPTPAAQNTSFKSSLLQSPARRPVSPTKVDEAGSPSRGDTKSSLFGGTPKATPFKISRFTTPRTLNLKAGVSRDKQMMPPPSAPPKFSTGSPKQSKKDDILTVTAEPVLKFSGRLSSIMPRSADPALNPKEPIPEEEENPIQQAEGVVDSMDIDQAETFVVEQVADANTTTPPTSPSPKSTGSFELRHQNESPFDDSESDSEDELASGSPRFSPLPVSGFNVSEHDFASSPVDFKPISTPKAAKSARPSLAALRSEKREKIGFTPLAAQLSSWMAASPEKPESVDSNDDPESPTFCSPDQLANDSPSKSTFFDDAMTVHDEMAAVPESEPQKDEIEQDFGPAMLDEEDVALANEADEMSLLDPEQLSIEEDVDMFAMLNSENVEAPMLDSIMAQPEITELELDELLRISGSEHIEQAQRQEENNIPDIQATEEIEESEVEIENATVIEVQTVEPALSEASQEYGDENDYPLDPALFQPAPFEPESAPTPTPAQRYSTPKRVLTERTFHTVSKVPLKAAADDTPMRPSPMKRSASISRIPSQRPTTSLTRKNTVISYSPTKDTQKAKTPQRSQIEATPSKSEWSTVATPARTPRRDINPGLLRGAVVFVDVHTTEGADASVLFTELLTQMGARCVKVWTWNGNGEESSKIGITHVVFKDGGKRTLEKVRETNGVVQCVGVGWVLDCERENQWLSESPYTVDTGLVPRGGHRRRKSMEPKALANLNGTLIPSATPSRSVSWNMSPSKEPQGTPLTCKSRRRDSVQWERSPASSSSDGLGPMDATDFLSPVPATPAPEAISAYGEEGLYGEDSPAMQTPYFLHKDQLIQKTAPVKRYLDEDNNDKKMAWLSQKKDESVMQRLMAARRKSLQFAPKVGSPLARPFRD